MVNNTGDILQQQITEKFPLRNIYGICTFGEADSRAVSLFVRLSIHH